MNLKPVANRILVQLHFPDESSGIVLPESSTAAEAGDKRTLVECLEVGPDVKVCKKGDFLLLIHDAMRNMIGVSKEPALVLLDAGVVCAIVTDDTRPVQLTVVPRNDFSPS